MPISEGRKLVGIVILVVILMLIFGYTIYTDLRRADECSSFCGAIDTANDPNREMVRAALAEVEYKRELSEIKARKMSTAILVGFIRGAIVGLVMGGEDGIIGGMVSFGSISGILYWLSDQLHAITHMVD